VVVDELRFGIVPLELANVVSLVGEHGGLDFSRFNFTEFLRATNRRGFSLMELTLDVGYVVPGGLTEERVEGMRRLKEELGLSFTAHLPLWSLEPASPNQYVRRASVDCLVDAVKLVEPLEPEVYVVHATGALAAEFSRLQMPEPFKGLIIQHFASFAEQSIKELLERTRLPPRRLAIENVEFPFDATWRIAERLDTSICFDTGHLLAGYSGTIGVMEFLERYYNRISEVHLHDGACLQVEGDLYRRIDHRALGEGQLPVKELLARLQELEFKGPIIFELTFREAQESLNLIKRLLPDLPIE